MDSFFWIEQRKLCLIETKINLKASVMRHHMHTQTTVSIQIDLETVFLNNN